MNESEKQNPSRDDLRKALIAAWASGRPHVERLTLAAAVLIEAFRQDGLSATLVGGGAIEFYAPGAYVTGDIDLVVETYSRDQIDRILRSLGLERSGRHWIRGDLFVEVPDSWMSDPVDEFEVGPFRLRVIRKEYLLGERIVGFRYSKAWAHGLQAIDMIAAFGDELDEPAVRDWLRREQAEDAFDLLREMVNSDAPITVQVLDELWHRHYRSGSGHGSSDGYQRD